MKRPTSNAPSPIDPRMLSNWNVPLPLLDILTAKSWPQLSSARRAAAADGYALLWTSRTLRTVILTLMLAGAAACFTGMVFIARALVKPDGQLTRMGIAAMLADISLLFLPPLLLWRGTFPLLRRSLSEAAFINGLENNAASDAKIAIVVRRALARCCGYSENVIRPDETHFSYWPSAGVILGEFTAYISEGLDCAINPMELAEKLRRFERRNIGDLIHATVGSLAAMAQSTSGQGGSLPTGNQSESLHAEIPPRTSTEFACVSDTGQSSGPRRGVEREFCYEPFSCQKRHLQPSRIPSPRPFVKSILRFSLLTALAALPVPYLIAACFPDVTDPWRTTMLALVALVPGVALLGTLIFLVYYSLLMLTLAPINIGKKEIRFAAPEQRVALSDIRRVDVGDVYHGRRKVVFAFPSGRRTIAVPEKTDMRRLQAALSQDRVQMSQPCAWHPQFAPPQDQTAIDGYGEMRWAEPFVRGFCLGEAIPFLCQGGLTVLLSAGLMAAAVTALGIMAHRNPAPLTVLSSIAVAAFIAISLTALALAAFQRHNQPEIIGLAPQWIDVGCRGFSLLDAKQITLKTDRWHGPVIHVHFPNFRLRLALPNSPQVIQKAKRLLKSHPAAIGIHAD